MTYKCFDSYCNWLFGSVPHEMYMMLSIILCVGTAILFGVFGVRKGLRYSLGLLLVEYVFLLLESTVFLRSSGAARDYCLIPFWSYQSYFRGEDEWLLPENIMNVAVFIPVGLLLGLIFRPMSWVKFMAIGACLSVGIELMQFVLKRGFAEFDDVMHNTAGCLIGYGIYILLSVSTKRLCPFFTARKKDLVSRDMR